MHHLFEPPEQEPVLLLLVLQIGRKLLYGEKHVFLSKFLCKLAQNVGVLIPQHINLEWNADKSRSTGQMAARANDLCTAPPLLR